MTAVMAASLPLAALLAPIPASAGPAPAAAPWRAALARVASSRDELSARLAEDFSALRARAAAEEPGLLPRLDAQAAPRPEPTGYQILPRIEADGPPSRPDAPPGERRYAISEVARWTDQELARAAALKARIAKGEKPLGPLVDEYLLLRENFTRIDNHIQYHQSWQPQAVESAGFFAQRNSLLGAYRLWRSTAAPQAARQAARRRLEERISSFSPTPGLRFQGPAGARVMIVPIQTDVSTQAFLDAFVEGVDRVWNDSAAMKRAGLSLRIEWVRVSPRRLYPEGPPAVGAPIDMAGHLARFPPGLVLTTGASATQAYPNRAIVLGAGGISRHSLAHEFSHLLGFTDGYLRAFDGSAGDPDGVVFWEITPFPDDLLADPGGGRVTEAMVRRLLEGYGGAR